MNSQPAGDMDQQADSSAESSQTCLFDLPASCLHHIVSFMDKNTKRHFFRTSKGSQDEPGCAVLVLRASKLKYSYAHYRNVIPRPAKRSLLHWAAQISTDMELAIGGSDDSCSLPKVLRSLLLYPDARATFLGHVLGKPAIYPGIIALRLWAHQGACLIPELVADAFPNLQSFTVVWVSDPSQPLGPVLRQGLSSLQHMDVCILGRVHGELGPGATHHIAQQLSHMPSLTSLHTNNDILQAMPAAALAKLQNLVLHAKSALTAEGKAALTACSQLKDLVLCCRAARGWVNALPLHAPSIQSLNVSINMSDETVPALLALPHLTSLTVNGIDKLSDDYSSAPCSWKQLKFGNDFNSQITRLPLHILDSPVECELFRFYLSDPATDLAAIKAAKPHLLRCGGIKVEMATVMIEVTDGSAITKQQAEEVLTEWAPCISVPECVMCFPAARPIVEDAGSRVWPGVQFDYLDWVLR